MPSNDNIIEKVNISGTEYRIRDALGGGITGTTAEIEAADQAGQIPEGMTVYVTDDAGTEAEHSAKYIEYDNAESGLDAVNVQDAVDEVVDSVSKLNSELSEIYSAPFIQMTITGVDWNGYFWLGNNAEYISKATIAYNVASITPDTTFTFQLLGNAIRVFILDYNNSGIRLATPNDSLSIAVRVYYIPKNQ